MTSRRLGLRGTVWVLGERIREDGDPMLTVWHVGVSCAGRCCVCVPLVSIEAWSVGVSKCLWGGVGSRAAGGAAAGGAAGGAAEETGGASAAASWPWTVQQAACSRVRVACSSHACSCACTLVVRRHWPRAMAAAAKELPAAVQAGGCRGSGGSDCGRRRYLILSILPGSGCRHWVR